MRAIVNEIYAFGSTAELRLSSAFAAIANVDSQLEKKSMKKQNCSCDGAARSFRTTTSEPEALAKVYCPSLTLQARTPTRRRPCFLPSV
jgi:hypothetical protein